ncbi:MAG: soluble lytic murein transglycosylase [Pseudomonadota bacterium]
MRTAWLVALSLTAAVACSVGTQGCSASLPSQSPGAPSALPPAVPPGAPPPQAGLLTPAGNATLTGAVDLSAFVPLLSMPELSSALQAFEVEDYATSAALVDKYIQGHPPSVFDEPRWYFLLGSLREKSSDLLAATGAYERSMSAAWPLADYAALGLGRSLLALADWDGAERALGNVADNASTYASARGLLAELACRRGQTLECLERARVFRAVPRKPLSWSAQAFRVAELLVGQVAPVAVRVDAVRADAVRADAARAADATAAPEVAPAVPVTSEDVLAVLGLVRSLIIDAPRTSSRYDASSLERRLLDALPEELRVRERQLSPNDQLARAEAFGNAGRNEEANTLVEALLTSLGQGAYGPVACQARLIQGKALLELKQRTRAESRFSEIIDHCKSDELRAPALYLAGKAAYQDDRSADADRIFARLELEAPKHRLADDGRLYRAQAQQDLGNDERFVALLESMPQDYPAGDMVPEGLFQLALRHMEKGNWPGARQVLARSLQFSGDDGAARGPEASGRERYFQARALIETGDVARGLDEYERIVAELPLSYYMLHAYSRLSDSDPARARRALDSSLQASGALPFRIEHQPEFDQPGFLRALELFRQSDIDGARRELELLNVLESGTSPSVLWGVALLYARAGSARLSHALPRWQLHDWLERWPAGPWKQAWELAFPRPHIEAVTEQAAREAVDPALAYAVMREESAFDADAVSPANAYGLMQLISPTARRFGKELGLPYDRRALTTPRVNIALGIRVLSNYRNYFPGDPLLVIPGYNAGPGRPMRWAKDWPSVDFDLWVELIPFRETRRYTKRVLASRGAYAFLYYQPTEITPANDPLRLPRRLSASSVNTANQ